MWFDIGLGLYEIPFSTDHFHFHKYMCVCVYIYVCVYTHTYMYLCCIFMCIYIYVCIYITDGKLSLMVYVLTLKPNAHM